MDNASFRERQRERETSHQARKCALVNNTPVSETPVFTQMWATIPSMHMCPHDSLAGQYLGVLLTLTKTVCGFCLSVSFARYFALNVETRPFCQLNKKKTSHDQILWPDG
ncbi:MAG TPA: hypothetical protein V6C97_02065 [Oculatellaceae cyanobacterium]